MADEAEVVVPEEGVVEVNIEGGIAPPKKAVEAEPEPKPQSRVQAPAPDAEATKALQAAEEALASERRLRQAAEQTATAATHQATQERTARLTREQELEQTRQASEARELTNIDANIANATREITATQKELSAALAAGEFEKVAEAQTRLSRASAALDRWEDRKANYEAKPAPAAFEGAVGDQEPVVQATPFERYIGPMAPAAQTWLRAHPECAPPQVGGKAELNSKMMRGHYDALAQGFTANSDDYFRVIEESTGFRKPVAPLPSKEDGGEEPKPRQRQITPSAPPSREPPGSPSTGGSKTVRLTKEQQEAARFSFPNLEPAKAYAEYAKNYVSLEAEGKLGRTSH
jgi:hypothetical protein